DVGEGHLVVLLGDQPGAGLAEGQRLRAATLHLAHEEDPHADEEDHRKPRDQERHVPGVLVYRAHADLDVLVAEQLDEVLRLDDVGAELAAVLELPGHEVAADRDGLNEAGVDVLEERVHPRSVTILPVTPNHARSDANLRNVSASIAHGPSAFSRAAALVKGPRHHPRAGGS